MEMGIWWKIYTDILTEWVVERYQQTGSVEYHSTGKYTPSGGAQVNID